MKEENLGYAERGNLRTCPLIPLFSALSSKMKSDPSPKQLNMTFSGLRMTACSKDLIFPCEILNLPVFSISEISHGRYFTPSITKVLKVTAGYFVVPP